MWITDIISALNALCDGHLEWKNLVDHIDHNLIYFTNGDIYSVTQKEWVKQNGDFTENYK